LARHRRQSREQPEIWPGFVDALSTLLLAIIFLLIVFVLGQFFLGQLLQGRNQTVQRLQGEVRDLASQLEVEQDAAAELRRTLSRLNADLRQAFLARDEAEGRFAQADAERDRLGERVATLTDEQASLRRSLDALRGEAEAARARSAELEQALAEARRTVTADRATIELQLGQLAQLRQDVDALQKVRQELEGRVASLADAEARGRAEREGLAAELGAARDRASALEARLADEAERTRLAQRELERRDLRLAELERTAEALGREREEAAGGREEALAQVRTLTEQIAILSRQLQGLGEALELKQQEIDRQGASIADLGQRLNVALASKVEELSQYRSEFFGRLRQSLSGREDVRIVGDRFVFQSEVLFPPGSAEISPAGQARLAQLAATLREITADIPDELPWVIQVDGHTDRRPIRTARFPSNWELSSSRAIEVARFLVSQGIPPERVAARGFAEFQPLDPGEGEEAYRRNRRIEIKLTTR
jgi:chemotaxis protein MotB